MKALVWSWLVLCICLCTAAGAGAQTPVGALAIDERQGEQWGWAVDYETAAAAQGMALPLLSVVTVRSSSRAPS